MTQYISANGLAKRYGVNRSTIWRWAQRDIIPKPIKLSDQCTRWRLDLIEQYDANRDGAAA